MSRISHKLILVFLIIYDVEGCWKSSSTTQPATTMQPPKQVEVVENIQAKSHQGVDSAQSRRGKNTNLPTASELKKLSEDLFKADTGSVGNLVKINHQGRSQDETRDAAPQKLFTSVSTRALEGSSVTHMQRLLDNYEPSVKTKELDTRQEEKEQDAFLNAIMKTAVIKKTESFLQQKKLITGPLKQQLKLIWFTPYSRHRGVKGSSGFEHVFLGELKNGQVSGFHNWVFFKQEEEEGDANYKGFLKIVDLGDKGEVLKFRFDWLNTKKTLGSMFIGTSPELEMALYTVCFYARPNKNCNLKLNGKNVSIKVYVQNYNGKKLIGSAYPIIY